MGFESAVFTHGIYAVGHCRRGCALRERSCGHLNVVHRKRRFIFSHDDTYHHTLMSEPRDHWDDEGLTSSQDRELTSYLSSRREGLFDWIVFHRPRRQDAGDIAQRLGLDRSTPIIGLLTNVS